MRNTLDHYLPLVVDFKLFARVLIKFDSTPSIVACVRKV